MTVAVEQQEELRRVWAKKLGCIVVARFTFGGMGSVCIYLFTRESASSIHQSEEHMAVHGRPGVVGYAVEYLDVAADFFSQHPSAKWLHLEAMQALGEKRVRITLWGEGKIRD